MSLIETGTQYNRTENVKIIFCNDNYYMCRFVIWNHCFMLPTNKECTTTKML